MGQYMCLSDCIDGKKRKKALMVFWKFSRFAKMKIRLKSGYFKGFFFCLLVCCVFINGFSFPSVSAQPSTAQKRSEILSGKHNNNVNSNKEEFRYYFNGKYWRKNCFHVYRNAEETFSFFFLLLLLSSLRFFPFSILHFFPKLLFIIISFFFFFAFYKLRKWF